MPIPGPGDSYAQHVRSAVPPGQPQSPPLPGPGMGPGAPAPGGPGQIPPQVLMQLIQLLMQLKQGGGAPMPGQQTPNLPPVPMPPNRPPGAY